MNSPLEYEKLQEKCIKYLNDRKFISAATGLQNQVRVRVVDYVNDGIRLGFLTWEDTLKMEHLKQNPAISLCVDSLQMEGKAKILGHPGAKENESFMDLYKERHPSPYKNFVSLANTSLIVVEPSLLILMKYENNHLYLDHLDITSKTAFRKELSPWTP